MDAKPSFWGRLFLAERPSIALAFFRLAVAFTVGAHIIPTLLRLGDNYLSTAFKETNASFFTPGVIALVAQSPDALIIAMTALFYVTLAFFAVGLFSQIACILMTACYCFFYALNSLPIGTLSFDILLVTLFLMCVTGTHGDFFSLDALRSGDPLAYKRKRPFFVQRLLQLQIASTLFYTALFKFTAALPAIFLFLFPSQLLLFIDPEKIVQWIENRRRLNELHGQERLVYDGHCRFCIGSVHRIQVLDLFNKTALVNYQEWDDVKKLDARLTRELCHSRMQLLAKNGKLYEGFFAFRYLAGKIVLLWPLAPFLYLPGMSCLGSRAYDFIARNRYLFHSKKTCTDNACFR